MAQRRKSVELRAATIPPVRRASRFYDSIAQPLSSLDNEQSGSDVHVVDASYRRSRFVVDDDDDDDDDAEDHDEEECEGGGGDGSRSGGGDGGESAGGERQAARAMVGAAAGSAAAVANTVVGSVSDLAEGVGRACIGAVAGAAADARRVSKEAATSMMGRACGDSTSEGRRKASSNGAHASQPVPDAPAEGDEDDAELEERRRARWSRGGLGRLFSG